MPPVEYRLDVHPYFFRCLADRDALHYQQKVFLELFQLLYAVNGGTGEVVEGLAARPTFVAPAPLVGPVAVYIRTFAVGTMHGAVIADVPADKPQIWDVELPVEKMRQFGLLVPIQIV